MKPRTKAEMVSLYEAKPKTLIDNEAWSLTETAQSGTGAKKSERTILVRGNSGEHIALRAVGAPYQPAKAWYELLIFCKRTDVELCRLEVKRQTKKVNMDYFDLYGANNLGAPAPVPEMAAKLYRWKDNEETYDEISGNFGKNCKTSALTLISTAGY